MTDRDLSELLERSAGRVLTTSPPLDTMITAARSRRRRRRGAGLVSALAVVVAGTAFAVTREPEVTGMVLDVPGPSRSPDSAPAGTRLVGVGHSAIAVPTDWATNALRCGTPTAPTVVIDVTAVEACGLLPAAVVESVWIDQGVDRSRLPDAHAIDIGGTPAQRSATVCTPAREKYPRCDATVLVPADHATYRVTAATADRVDEILSWIRAVPDQVAVPGFGQANMRHQDDDAGAHYRAELDAAGLDVRVITRARPGEKPGYVLGVDPQPGTMLAPGTTVTMTEIAEPRGPADEVSVEINSVGPGDSMDYVGRTDSQVRSGARIHLAVGSTIWFIGSGPRGDDLEGVVTGTSLAPDGWKAGPNYGRSWQAVTQGTSTMTIRLTTADGPITIGTVTVVVG